MMQVSQIVACDINESIFTLPLVDDTTTQDVISTNEDTENNESVRKMISSLLHV
jgi:hypothetical protein